MSLRVALNAIVLCWLSNSSWSVGQDSDKPPVQKMNLALRLDVEKLFADPVLGSLWMVDGLPGRLDFGYSNLRKIKKITVATVLNSDEDEPPYKVKLELAKGVSGHELAVDMLHVEKVRKQGDVLTGVFSDGLVRATKNTLEYAHKDYFHQPFDSCCYPQAWKGVVEQVAAKEEASTLVISIATSELGKAMGLEPRPLRRRRRVEDEKLADSQTRAMRNVFLEGDPFSETAVFYYLSDALRQIETINIQVGSPENLLEVNVVPVAESAEFLDVKLRFLWDYLGFQVKQFAELAKQRKS